MSWHSAAECGPACCPCASIADFRKPAALRCDFRTARPCWRFRNTPCINAPEDPSPGAAIGDDWFARNSGRRAFYTDNAAIRGCRATGMRRFWSGPARPKFPPAKAVEGCGECIRAPASLFRPRAKNTGLSSLQGPVAYFDLRIFGCGKWRERRRGFRTAEAGEGQRRFDAAQIAAAVESDPIQGAAGLL